MSVLTPPAPGLLEAKAKLFRGFSDRSRLSLLEALREEPRSVSELVALTGLTQPNVSNHLACLRDCGLVQAERVGRFQRYRLSDARVGQMLALIDDLLAEVATGVAACCNSRGESPSS
ncbi:ArsR/SmtB family transcription factor [Deinococcus aestuarii]|uniref:ArsR/SmtB family transcription factor n=1 Tax=Deinococcus aestuarii TaxID=2774531 RepID=UPI001C0DC3CF|nr:metalloregulator ArsR/SmtB family transcription factor [Deinococcus aestuarii]